MISHRYSSIAAAMLILAALASPIAAASIPPATSPPGINGLKDLWVRVFNESVSAMPYYDFDGDGTLDIVARTSDSVLFIDGATGLTISSYMAPVNTSIADVILLDDLDSDGAVEVLIELQSTITGNNTHFYLRYEPLSGDILWRTSFSLPSSTSMMVFSSPLPYIGDNYIVKAYGLMDLSGLAPTMETYLVTIDTGTGEATSQLIENQVYMLYTNVLVGDLDNDGLIEEDIGTYTITSYLEMAGFPVPSLQSTLEVSGPQGAWTASVDNAIIPVAFASYDGASAHLLAPVIVLAGQSLELYLYSYSLETGSEEYNIDLGQGFPSAFSIAGDTMVLGSYNDAADQNILMVIDTSSGTYTPVPVGGNQSTPLSSMSIGDVDGDGHKELFFGLGNTVYIMDLETHQYLVAETYIGNVSLMDGGLYNISGTGETVYLVEESIEAGLATTTILHAARYTGTGGGNDTTPPDIEIITPMNNSLVGRSVYVAASAADPESGIAYVEISVEGPGLSLSDNMSYDPAIGMAYYSFNATSNGDYQITVTAVNNAGLEASSTITVTADIDPPVITITSPGNMSTVTGDEIDVVFTVSDAHSVSGIVAFDDIPVATWKGLGEHEITISVPGGVVGQHKISVVAGDAAGNVAEEYVYVIISGEDTTPPYIVINEPREGQLLPPSIHVEATVYDNESGVTSVTLTVYRGDTVVETLPMTYYSSTSTAAADIEIDESGTYTLVVTAVNGVGGEANASVTIEVDADAPEVQIISPQPGSYITPSFTITVSVDDAHPDTLTVHAHAPTGAFAEKTIELEEPGTISVTLNLSELPPGPVTVMVIANDTVGNEKRIVAHYTLVENPVPVITPPFENGTVLSGNVTIYLAATCDLEFSITLYLDGQSAGTFTDITGSINASVTIDTTLYEDGPLNITIVAVSEYGVSVETVFVYIDNHPPMISTPYPRGEAVWLGRGEAEAVGDNMYRVTIPVNVSDTTLSRVEAYVDGELVANASSLDNLTITIQGGVEHNITIKAYDRAGFTTTYSFTIGIDTEPPTISFFKANVSGNNVTFTWSISDDASGVASAKLYIDGSSYDVTGSTSYTISLSPGTYHARLVVRDKAGNTAEENTTFTITAEAGGGAGGAGGAGGGNATTETGGAGGGGGAGNTALIAGAAAAIVLIAVAGYFLFARKT